MQKTQSDAQVMEEEFTLSTATASIRDVNRQADQLWSRVFIEGSVENAWAKEQNLPIASLPRNRSQVLAFTELGAGLDPGSVAIGVAAIHLGNRLVWDFWKRILRPKLEQVFGLKPKPKPARNAVAKSPPKPKGRGAAKKAPASKKPSAVKKTTKKRS